MRLNRHGTLAVLLAPCATLLATQACSSNDDTPPAINPTMDAAAEGGDMLATDAAAEADAPYVCADQPFDCSEPGDAGAFAVPAQLRCAGLYQCWSNKEISPNDRPYTPGVVLYSDNATKQRWLRLPAGSTIDTTNKDDWSFPVGTMAWKEFRIDGKRIETRRIWKASATQFVYSVWRWSADGETSATLLENGERNAAGTYEVPSVGLCVTCHGSRPEKFLSLEPFSLGIGAASGVTLATLKNEGRLSNWTAPTPMALPEDSTGKAAAALGWLHANCGSCHAPSGSAAFTGLFMRLSLADLADAGAGGVTAPVTATATYRTAVNQPMTRPMYTSNAAYNGFKRIYGGNANLSLIPAVDSLRDPDGGLAVGQMPPILRHQVDTAGVDAVRAWAGAL